MIQYISYQATPPDEMLTGIMALHETIFQTEARTSMEEMKRKGDLTIFLALDSAKVVGYKIGYQRKPRHYYSWLGGVDPAYRKQGIGAMLIRMQHEWCEQHHYQTIRTHTKNKWREMLILNIRHGFDIIGTMTDAKGEPKIILEKRFGSFKG